ncbi:symmetrical bis(5'-nucleosyl)-tetraphosphatase [bacterium]|nr:symmetrical bis(5'-nucleosyl)-tetraphosphatase [bacterium]
MAIYAIGDVQGCFNELNLLLDKINFIRGIDRLWFTGDLVNRGPNSLETLRLIKSLGDSATVVLGNHDLHLLACYYGKRKPHKSDTLDAILSAGDCDELLDWLRQQPLLHYEENYCLVHAGLPPQWNLSLARQCAKKVESILCNPDRMIEFFRWMYGELPKKWEDGLDEWSMTRFIVNALTRMRYCTRDGSIDIQYKGSPGSQPTELVPWFDHPDRQSRSLNIVFGHWSTLGITNQQGIYSLDTGCLWGGQLTALRIDVDCRKYFQVECECIKRNFKSGS